jgi:hypothetical protein
MQIGETSVEYVDSSSTSADIGSPGQSSWDFSNWEYDRVIEAENLQPSEGMSSDEFPAATVVEQSSTDFAGFSSELYNYVLLTSEEYANVGNYSSSVAGGVSSETLMTLDQPETIAYLPLNYGDSWDQTTTRSFEIETSGFINTHTVDSDITRSVDAYGTLTFPNGTTEEVLRVKVETEMTTNIPGTTPTTSYDLHYTFFSKSGAFLTVTAADHEAPDNGTIDIIQVIWAYGSSATDVAESDELPTEFNLAQNYPNPFNPETSIEYSIPEKAHVTLKVYDLLGNEIAVLVDGELDPGVYKNKFDGSSIASGIYIYTLKSEAIGGKNEPTLVKKMLLMK